MVNEGAIINRYIDRYIQFENALDRLDSPIQIYTQITNPIRTNSFVMSFQTETAIEEDNK